MYTLSFTQVVLVYCVHVVNVHSVLHTGSVGLLRACSAVMCLVSVPSVPLHTGSVGLLCACRAVIIIIIIIITVFVRRKLLIKSTLSAQQTKAKRTHTHTHTHISRHARTHAMKPTVGVVGVELIRIIIRERKTSEFLGTS